MSEITESSPKSSADVLSKKYLNVLNMKRITKAKENSSVLFRRKSTAYSALNVCLKANFS